MSAIRPFWGSPRKMAAGHFASHFLAISSFGHIFLVDVLDIFSFFSAWGGGMGGVRGEGGCGVDFVLKIPGGGSPGGRGAEGPGASAANWGTWGGGVGA